MELEIYDASDFPKDFPFLQDICKDALTGGKAVRGLITLHICQLLDIGQKEGVTLAKCVEFIHNSSILHDDIIDQTRVRRQLPSLWEKYSTKYALLAADYLLARSTQKLAQLGSMHLIEYSCQALSDLTEGEWLQAALISNHLKLSKENLLKVQKKKTGTLFRWAFTAPFLYLTDQRLTDQKPEPFYQPEIIKLLGEVGDLIGILFQRNDDIIDFNVRNYQNKKTFTDLEIGIVNSFAYEIFQDLNESQKKRVSKNTK